MKRKFIMLSTAMLLALSLAGCGSSTMAEADDYDPESESMFVKVEDGQLYYVVYHKDTKVMYAVSDSSYNYGNFTLLVNPDGSPMIYDGE